MRKIVFFIFWVTILYLNTFLANSQIPTASFSEPSIICRNQQVNFVNNSTNATSYIWDFSFNDLNGSVDTKLATTASGSVTPVGITFIFGDNSWFGFVMSRDNNKIFRLDFGSSLENTPTITDLGNIGGLLSGPQNLEIIYEGGIYYGIVTNFFGNNLVRLNFLSGLGAAPTADNLGSFGVLSSPRGMDIKFDGTNYVAIVSNFSTNSMSIVNFATSITNNPTASDASTLAVSITNPIGVRLMTDGSNWFGFVASFGSSAIVRLDFGTTLLSAITTKSTIYSLSSPTELSVQKEGDVYHIFAATASGQIHHVNLGTALSGFQSALNLGNFSVMNNTFALDIVRSSPIWYGFTVDYANGKIYQMKFENTLLSGVSIASSVMQTPDSIIYTNSGDYFVELTAKSNLGVDVLQKTITIQNLSAPEISISSDNSCLGNPTTFTASEKSGMALSTFLWNFGDSQTSGAPSPTHTYASANQYNLKLDVTAANGCASQVSKTIGIFNPPVSSFTLPTNNPLCTNQQFTFTNTSTSDVGSSLSWEWFVNGSSVSTSKDLLQTFSTTSIQTIKLRANIPGCFTESTQSINSLLAGPELGFTISGKCEDDNVIFTNTTTDPVNGFTWDFGDSQSSNATDATHIYPTPGSYNVALQASNANGCQNTLVKSLIIYTKPVPDFSLSLPPFSCTGSPSQFNDLTSNPVDSNLASWAWNFDDPGSGLNSSAVRNAQHTYSTAGDYNVSLTAKTNFGCQATIVKKVTVSQAPQIAFSNTPACQNLGTNFNDESDNAQSWFWQIENTTYNIKNPIHVFAASGNYSVNLTVTSTNNCISYLSKSVNVPKPLTPDFSFQKNCANQNTEFDDLTDDSVDPVTAQLWTFGTLGTTTGSPAIFTFPSAGAVSTTMEVTAQSGCKYSVTKSVSIVNAPTALFTASPEAGVPPLDVTFSNSSSNASSYLWTFNDSNNTTSTDASTSFTFNEIGDHVVDLTAYNNLGCSDTFSKIIKAMLPVYDISLIGFNILKNDDGSLKLIAALHNEGNVSVTNMALELSLSGVTSVREAVTETISPQASANHILNYEITDASKLEFLCVTVILANDLSTDNNERCITLDKPYFLYDPYPNPASDELTISWIADSTEPLSIILIDALGNQVMTTSLSSEQGLNSVKMLTDGLADGIYAMFLKYGSYKEIKRISIEH